MLEKANDLTQTIGLIQGTVWVFDPLILAIGGLVVYCIMGPIQYQIQKEEKSQQTDLAAFCSVLLTNASAPLCAGKQPLASPATVRGSPRFYTLCMPKSEVQEALSSYFSSFVSRSAELEKSFLSWYRVCRLDSGLYILSVTKVSEKMSWK